jgi:exosome complex RNA-binding protein Rrp42 (RNase PH superfamily)
MFMPKQPLSVTLDEQNVLWLKGRAASTKRRSLSEALDALITAARAGGAGADAVRSVAGTVDIADDDPDLRLADSYVNAVVTSSIERPFIAREQAPDYGPQKGKRRG